VQSINATYPTEVLAFSYSEKWAVLLYWWGLSEKRTGAVTGLNTNGYHEAFLIRGNLLSLRVLLKKIPLEQIHGTSDY
jgi:hypothetical protein